MNQRAVPLHQETESAPPQAAQSASDRHWAHSLNRYLTSYDGLPIPTH